MNTNEERNPKIRVIVADDHFATRIGLSTLLSHDGYDVVASVNNGDEAVLAVQAHHPDLVLLDLRMPVCDGIEASRRIRSMDLDTRIVILTTYDEVEDIEQSLEAGADTYLLKGTAHEEFLGQLKQVMRGESRLPERIKERLDEYSTRAKLSGRELETLQRLACGRSNSEIAKELFISEATVKTHLKNIFRKLGVEDRVGAVVVAIRDGIVRLGED